jgi:regulatory protein YycH of two-component signal transduction system YycFG
MEKEESGFLSLLRIILIVMISWILFYKIKKISPDISEILSPYIFSHLLKSKTKNRENHHNQYNPE